MLGIDFHTGRTENADKKIDGQDAGNDDLHQKVQSYLEDRDHDANSEWLVQKMYAKASQVGYRLEEPSFILSLINELENEIRKEDISNKDDIKYSVLGLLENFYNKCCIVYEKNQADDLFLKTLEFLYRQSDDDISSFIEDAYPDCFA